MRNKERRTKGRVMSAYGVLLYSMKYHACLRPHLKLEADVFPVADVAPILPDLPQTLPLDGRNGPCAEHSRIRHA